MCDEECVMKSVVKSVSDEETQDSPQRGWDKKCMMKSVLCRVCAEACMLNSV